MRREDRRALRPYHPLLANDLKIIKLKDHAELSQRALGLKRMLSVLLQKLNAHR